MKLNTQELFTIKHAIKISNDILNSTISQTKNSEFINNIKLQIKDNNSLTEKIDKYFKN